MSQNKDSHVSGTTCEDTVYYRFAQFYKRHFPISFVITISSVIFLTTIGLNIASIVSTDLEAKLVYMLLLCAYGLEITISAGILNIALDIDGNKVRKYMLWYYSIKIPIDNIIFAILLWIYKDDLGSIIHTMYCLPMTFTTYVFLLFLPLKKFVIECVVKPVCACKNGCTTEKYHEDDTSTVASDVAGEV
jgi:hypothetical protein